MLLVRLCTDHVAAVADVEDDEYGDNFAAVTAAVAGDVGGDDDHGDHVAAVTTYPVPVTGDKDK